MSVSFFNQLGNSAATQMPNAGGAFGAVSNAAGSAVTGFGSALASSGSAVKSAIKAPAKPNVPDFDPMDIVKDSPVKKEAFAFDPMDVDSPPRKSVRIDEEQNQTQLISPRGSSPEFQYDMEDVSQFPDVRDPEFHGKLAAVLQSKHHTYNAAHLADPSTVDPCAKSTAQPEMEPYQRMASAVVNAETGINSLVWFSAGSGKTLVMHAAIGSAIQTGRNNIFVVGPKGLFGNITKETSDPMTRPFIHPKFVEAADKASKRAEGKNPEGDEVRKVFESEFKKIDVYLIEFTSFSMPPTDKNSTGAFHAAMREGRAFVVIDEVHQLFDFPNYMKSFIGRFQSQTLPVFHRHSNTGKNQIVALSATPSAGGVSTLGSVLNMLRREGSAFPVTDDAWKKRYADVKTLASDLRNASINTLAIDVADTRKFATLRESVLAVAPTKSQAKFVVLGHRKNKGTPITDVRKKNKSGYGSELADFSQRPEKFSCKTVDKWSEENAKKVVVLAANLRKMKGLQFVWGHSDNGVVTRLTKVLECMGFDVVELKHLKSGKLPGKDYNRVIALGSSNVKGSIRDGYILPKWINAPENADGKNIRFIISDMDVMISLHNIRGEHAFSVPRSIGSWIQLLARGRRRCSHKDLPVDQRTMDAILYFMVEPGNPNSDLNKSPFGDMKILEHGIEDYRVEVQALQALSDDAINIRADLAGKLAPAPIKVVQRLEAAVREALGGVKEEIAKHPDEPVAVAVHSEDVFGSEPEPQQNPNEGPGSLQRRIEEEKMQLAEAQAKAEQERLEAELARAMREKDEARQREIEEAIRQKKREDDAWKEMKAWVLERRTVSSVMASPHLSTSLPRFRNLEVSRFVGGEVVTDFYRLHEERLGDIMLTMNGSDMLVGVEKGGDTLHFAVARSEADIQPQGSAGSAFGAVIGFGAAIGAVVLGLGAIANRK